MNPDFSFHPRRLTVCKDGPMESQVWKHAVRICFIYSAYVKSQWPHYIPGHFCVFCRPLWSFLLNAKPLRCRKWINTSFTLGKKKKKKDRRWCRSSQEPQCCKQNQNCRGWKEPLGLIKSNSPAQAGSLQRVAEVMLLEMVRGGCSWCSIKVSAVFFLRLLV